jgi:hypothetical protein
LAYGASSNAAAAPMSSISVTFVELARKPPASTPSGTMPPNPMIHSAMIRPRILSSRFSCRTVASDVITRK